MSDLKPDDICLILAGNPPHDYQEHVGKVVRLVELKTDDMHGAPGWVTDPQTFADIDGRRTRIIWSPHHLRRLDNPDGVDETLRDNPAPVDAFKPAAICALTHERRGGV